jgi:hypothetical protein
MFNVMFFLDADLKLIGEYSFPKLRHTKHAGTLLVVRTSRYNPIEKIDLLYQMDVNQVNSEFVSTVDSQSNILSKITYDIFVPNYSKNFKIHYQNNIQLSRPQRGMLLLESTVNSCILGTETSPT